MREKRYLYFRFQWPWLTFLDLKFAPLVTPVQRYISTKLEHSTAFLFGENRRQGTDGRTDGRRWCST